MLITDLFPAEPRPAKPRPKQGKLHKAQPHGQGRPQRRLVLARKRPTLGHDGLVRKGRAAAATRAKSGSQRATAPRSAPHAAQAGSAQAAPLRLTEQGTCPSCGWRLIAPALEKGRVKIVGERVVTFAPGRASLWATCKRCRNVVVVN